MDKVEGLKNLQLELLKVFSFDLEEKQLQEIHSLLGKYFSERVTLEMDEL